MSIFNSMRPRKRAVVALATLAATAGALTVGGALGAPTASAARCATAGHVYLTQPGRTIFSGYEGNQQFGVPTVTYAQGTESFRLGGNGISPGSVHGLRLAAAGSLLWASYLVFVGSSIGLFT